MADKGAPGAMKFNWHGSHISVVDLGSEVDEEIAAALGEIEECDQGVNDGQLLLEVPPVRQQTDFSCGAACLASVLQHFGLAADEAGLRQALGADPQAGTDPDAIQAVARKLGMKAAAVHGMDSGMVHDLLEKGRLIIAPIQAYGTEVEQEQADSGHYVVICGSSPSDVHFMDPARGEIVEMPWYEFAARWYDRAADGERYRDFGVVLRGY